MKILSLILVLFISVGCLKKENDSKIITTSAFIDSNFHGKWQKCEIDGAESILYTQIISLNSVISSTDFYDNTNCDDNDHIFTSSVMYKVSNQSPLTLSLTKATFTPQSSVLANSWISQSYCGILNWAGGFASDITNKDCNGITFTYGDSFEVSYSRSGNILNYEADGEVGSLDLVP